MDKNYKFFKKIKPNTYIWSTSMQTRIMFEDEVWIAVESEHTTWCTGDAKVFYGNIFTNNTGFYLTSPDIEFEVWEDTQTVGKRYNNQKDVPLSKPMPLFVDFTMNNTFINNLVNCIKPNETI